MNTESMPLKHDHQQYADPPAAGAPFGTTTKTTTRTTLVTRAIVVVCGVAAVVAGVTYLSTGLYPRSPVVTNHRDSSPVNVASGATGGVLRKGSTSTGTNALDNATGHRDDETPTREAFIARYPELMDISPEDQAVQYEAYLFYLNGMTVKELDAYYYINDNGQQEGGGRAGATSALINDGQQGGFWCCKDKNLSAGCQGVGPEYPPLGVCWRKTPEAECVVSTRWGTDHICCRSSPNSRVGTKFWVFSECT